MKKDHPIELENLTIMLIPNEDLSAGYLWIGNSDGDYVDSIDKDDRKVLRRLQTWIEKLLEDEK